jgi:hypothetical protein
MVDMQKITGTGAKKRKAKGKGNNPRIKQRDEIKDPDLIRVKRWCRTAILFVIGSTLIRL